MVESGAETLASVTKRSRLAALERKHSAPHPSPVATPVTPVVSATRGDLIPVQPASSISPFLSSNPSSKPDSIDSTYAKLSPSVLRGPLASKLQLQKDTSKSAVDTVVWDLLASNAKTAGNIAGTIENRLLDRPFLLDNPATQGGAVERAKERALRARSKRSAKHLSMRQHRRAGSFDLPAEYQKYGLYTPMHEMWKEYAKTLVADCNDAMLQPRLLAADLHGAVLAVVPKAGTVFMLQLDSIRITLIGNNLFSRQLQPTKQQQAKQTIKL